MNSPLSLISMFAYEYLREFEANSAKALKLILGTFAEPIYNKPKIGLIAIP
jgi:hypothetical protein